MLSIRTIACTAVPKLLATEEEAWGAIVLAQLSVQSKGSSRPTQYFFAQALYVQAPHQVLIRTHLRTQTLWWECL